MKQAIIDILGKPFWETLPELFLIAGAVTGAICVVVIIHGLVVED